MKSLTRTLIKYGVTALILLVLGYLALYYFACKYVIEGDHFLKDKTQQAILSECSERMRLTFPKGTRLVKADGRNGWLGMTIFLKVEMEGADLPSFLKNSPFAKANFKTYKRTSTAAAPPSWLGDDLKEYIASSVSLADRPPNLNVRLDIVIDKTRQNTAVVYLLYWFP